MNKNISETKWHALGVEDTLAKLQTNLHRGLSGEEVLARQKKYPSNQVVTEGKDNIFRRFFRQFHNALIYILLGSVLIALYLNQWVDASVIFGVVIINAIFGFLQEGKAEKALQAIRNLLAPEAEVIRDGRKVIIAAAQLVPGDIVVIKRGDKIPADLRLCQAKNLQVDEAILTGESLPVEKSIIPVLESAVIGECYSMLYSGTLVTDGRGLGLVVTTGKETEVGKISEALARVESIDTPLLKQMSRFGRWLTLLIMAIAAVVFLVGVLVWHNFGSELFIAIIGLVVAAVPEGLPPVITIILAIGVTRMAKRKAIVRLLPAVETMGAVTTICTDKTGTLTRNQLKVQSIITVDGVRPSLNGSDPIIDLDLKEAIKIAVLCNDADYGVRPSVNGSDPKSSGNPIDAALMSLGLKVKVDPNLLHKKFPRNDVIPYETEHKFMATLNHDHEGNSFIFLKGAPEIVLDKCSSQQVNGELKPLDKNFWQKNIEKLASLGERVIAVATKKITSEKSALNFNDVEDEMVLIGLFGLADPPREEAALAVKECDSAGINVKMITGDHAITAKTIANRIGIDGGEVLTGEMIDKMSDEELAQVVPRVNIYARTVPEQKLRLVKALQLRGEIVAMTGDGVNDAPALKQANIGVAMGEKGADIAKESGEMVLADDNFSTIVNAVRAGRTIYDNLKKVILFILPVSFAQAFVVIIAVLFGLTLPITPVQILWVNMITAITLALALGFEQAEPDIMQRPPRDAKVLLLSWYLLWRVFLVSLVMVAVIFGAFIFVSWNGVGLEVARTVAVNVLVVSEIMYLINCRNLKKSSINLQTFFGSKPVLISIGIMILLQLFFTYVPFMQIFFDTVTIGFTRWGYILLAAVISFGLIEAEKAIIR